MTFGAMLLVLMQAAIGMVVNLYVTIPKHHPGAQPSEYFGGSFHSVIWAIGHGAAALALHTALGLALVLTVIASATEAIRSGDRSAAVWSILAALLVLGAGFNGASFIDFNDNASSLIMALLGLAAVASYAVVLLRLASPPEAVR
ncbi:MAG: hypothetical protein JO153_00460 [Solirubrobacterales bacterium]|nr:hypothetical protein [Solirubrobacterales bacterium]